MVLDQDLEAVVKLYYRPLYQFAFSLTRNEADASDLAQQTFYIWQTKGHQLHDKSKIKTWLFTTLHREYLNSRRRFQRFPHFELEQMDADLPTVPPQTLNSLDTATLLETLSHVEEPYQAAISLFYLEDYSYKEIAEILNIPMGTVKSRLARGIAQLQRLLVDTPPQPTFTAQNAYE